MNNKKFSLKSVFNLSSLSKIIIGVILFAIIVVPIVRMMFYITPKAWSNVFSSDQFYTSLLNSFTSTLVATTISIVLAYALAWAINRTNIRFKYIITILIT